MNEETPKIESGIKMPEGLNSKWSFMKDMKVGQSFVTDLGSRACVIAASRHKNIKVATRSISDTEIRVWRIK